MKKLLLITTFILSSVFVFAQTKITGTVKLKNGEAIPFANIQIADSYDGASADENGVFNFETFEEGNKKLQVSMVGYLPFETDLNLNGKAITLDIILKEEINALNAVVVTAGTFEASDSKKMVMLKPLDIVTTAGGGADITAVMQLLPGANRVGESEGLFVRGGSANETKTVIDGMIVQNPFFSSTPDVPQRGRFSPFMFKGTAFSTGGYSAQYGQALSSVLLLDTQDKIGKNSNWNLNANMAGLSGSYTHKGWITANVGYTNLSPLFSLVKTNIDFAEVPQGFGGSITVNENLGERSVVKAYVTLTDNRSGLNLPTYETDNSTYLFTNRNKNLFTNASFRTFSEDGKWGLQTGLSYSNNSDQLKIADNAADRNDERTQTRIVGQYYFGNNKSSTLTVGGEFHHIKVANIYNAFDLNLTDNYSATFAETEFYLTPKLAVRAGLRAEYTSVISKSNIAPRLSAAYKLGPFAQLSLAAGRFYQNPEKEYLYLNKQLDFELADHLILNYQIIKNKRTFRVEGFYKDYKNLVTEEIEGFDPNPYRFPIGLTDNDGFGYAKGFDVFFRDQKSIKNAEVWVTYSFLDTERKFRNYPSQVQPYFASKHNLSLVYKQWIDKLGLNVGATFTHTSGRPFYGYNDAFKTQTLTPNFQNLSLQVSKIKQVKNNFIVVYAALDNVLARQNVFGYRFSADGTESFEVKPPVYRTFFIGISWSIGQLDRKPKEASLDI
ncbi:Outer membrane receptor for ferrienterochelin and colicins [Spirosomataceae bacterium TFI 002]|nr:Outer membrane receptor for ferrienterochelin and colicins [Spirosomataceae bacterium TFI 002]